MTPEEQVDEWVKGNPIHNHERYIHTVDENDNIVKTELLEGGECCPDFSCCERKLLWSEELRLMFKKADETKRQEMMMMMSLGNLVSQVDSIKAYIADGTDPTEH